MASIFFQKIFIFHITYLYKRKKEKIKNHYFFKKSDFLRVKSFLSYLSRHAARSRGLYRRAARPVPRRFVFTIFFEIAYGFSKFPKRVSWRAEYRLFPAAVPGNAPAWPPHFNHRRKPCPSAPPSVSPAVFRHHCWPCASLLRLWARGPRNSSFPPRPA